MGVGVGGWEGQPHQLFLFLSLNKRDVNLNPTHHCASLVGDGLLRTHTYARAHERVCFQQRSQCTKIKEKITLHVKEDNTLKPFLIDMGERSLLLLLSFTVCRPPTLDCAAYTEKLE